MEDWESEISSDEFNERLESVRFRRYNKWAILGLGLQFAQNVVVDLGVVLRAATEMAAHMHDLYENDRLFSDEVALTLSALPVDPDMEEYTYEDVIDEDE